MTALEAKVSAPQLNKSADRTKTPISYPFWFGGSASCFAAFFTHPLDLVKVRLQTQQHGALRRNMLQMFVHVAKDDGVRALYRGLSAAQLRQLTYSMTRFAIYEELKVKYTSPTSQPAFLTLVAMAAVSGFVGGIAGNPGDILNVRMQHDAALPVAQRRNYKHALDGLVKMARTEGVASLWRGAIPNSSRAALMTVGQLASYDGFKRALLDHTPLKDNLTTHFTASVLAGFVATTIASPVDVIKTKIMSSTGTQSVVHIITESFRAEGIRWMFKGWVPSFIRIGPHTILTFLAFEEQKKYYRKIKEL